MAATTVLGPGGYPRPAYGNFSGKPTSVVAPRFTVLGLGGYPRPPWASFAGKPATKSGSEDVAAFFRHRFGRARRR